MCKTSLLSKLAQMKALLKSARLIVLATLLCHSLVLFAGECDFGSNDYTACLKRHETNLLVRHRGTIQRNGGSLYVHSTNGANNIFRNILTDDDKHIVHYAWSILPKVNWLAIHVYHYEWRSQILVSLKSGQILETPNHNPIVSSPDYKYIAVYSIDMGEAHYEPNVVQIYRIDQTQVKLEFSESGDPPNNGVHSSGLAGEAPNYWGPSSPRWIDNDMLTYDELRETMSGSLQATTVQLKRINDKWQKMTVIEKMPLDKSSR